VEDISMTKPEEEKKSIKDTKFSRMLQDYWGVDDWIGLGLAAAGVFYYLFKGMLINYPGWHTFYESIHAELIGIGVTVLILGNANQHMRIQQEKRRLILQMGSPDNSFAREAVRQLKFNKIKWLKDGSLNFINLSEADLSGAHLEKANLRKSNLRHTILNETNLWLANLNEAHMENAFLNDAKLRGANLNKATLIQAYLEGADISDAKLNDAELWKANLNGADLRGAHLGGAVLRKIIFNSDTIWTGAKYTQNTQWPEGFDPEAAGCILVEDE
jgi:uncharacterized protein YjbI with pentapeptide repeats